MYVSYVFSKVTEIFREAITGVTKVSLTEVNPSPEPTTNFNRNNNENQHSVYAYFILDQQLDLVIDWETGSVRQV